jgi:hypothetical protein
MGRSLGLNGQVAVTGFSRGSTAAALAVGDGRVDAYEDATRGHYPEESSLVQCALLGSGMFDYDMRVGCNSHELVISLDQYILPYTEKFNYFNSPLFLVQQSRRQYLVTDCMEAIGRQHIAIPQDKEMSLLDYMVAEGKAIYFAEQTLPDTPDSIFMRYSKPQMEWMQKNETNVWSYLLQKKVLYDNDYMRFHNLIDDAPKTNAFRDSSPRTPYYIGWKIVSRYVENTGVSMDELFEETDAQKILSKSNYRPK